MDKYDKYFERIGLEWQYILWSKSYPYRYKAGRSTGFSARVSAIQASMSYDAGKEVHVSCFWKMPVFWAGASEKAIHGCLLWRSAENMPGSGHTEWSWSCNPYTAILFYLLMYAYCLPLWPALIVAALPFPLDFALITILLAVIQYGLAGLTLYGLWNIFF